MKTAVDKLVQRKLPDHTDDFRTLEKMEWAFSKRDISTFQSVLEAPSSIVLRIHAVCMLADIKNEQAVPSLCRPLQKDPSPLVRHEAAFALGQLGFKSAVPPLNAPWPTLIF
ncbi:HEAT repeat domain-containing protein [Candidatus Bathyarchaeota archaeon]|nr:MAG: HEAT repeat domain-containing protein [Candidatus Bathyarchaeota archaeon]